MNKIGQQNIITKELIINFNIHSVHTVIGRLRGNRVLWIRVRYFMVEKPFCHFTLPTSSEQEDKEVASFGAGIIQPKA